MAVNFLGQFLLQKGVISQEQLADALEYRREQTKRTGDLAVEKKLLSRSQVKSLLAEQEKTDLHFGEIAVQRGYLSREELDDLLFSRIVSRMHLGEILMEKGYLPQEQYEALMREYDQLESDRRLNVGYLLEETGENRILAALVGALEKGFNRFVGEGFKVDTLGADLDETLYDFSFLFQAGLENHGLVKGHIFMSREAVRRVVEAFTGGVALAEAEALQKSRRFFTIVNRYFRSGLEKRGFQVGKPRRVVAVKSVPLGEEERSGSCITMLLATPSGPIALHLCLSSATREPRIV